MVYALTSVAGGVTGFAVGLFAFKVKSRWCPACGHWTCATIQRRDAIRHTGQ